jgi:hypothetical protein
VFRQERPRLAQSFPLPRATLGLLGVNVERVSWLAVEPVGVGVEVNDAAVSSVTARFWRMPR